MSDHSTVGAAAPQRQLPSDAVLRAEQSMVLRGSWELHLSVTPSEVAARA
ncbi:MAG: hypothetical protein IPM45_06120 [Acidimicrobiales bacterium]|nr:hypothetical protein [Acidimicrobiales bacterium]